MGELADFIDKIDVTTIINIGKVIPDEHYLVIGGSNLVHGVDIVERSKDYGSKNVCFYVNYDKDRLRHISCLFRDDLLIVSGVMSAKYNIPDVDEVDYVTHIRLKKIKKICGLLK